MEKEVMPVAPPTYSLRGDQPNSDQYYREVAVFADEVLAKAASIELPVDAFQSYLEATGRETPRSREEYLLEVLALGVLWRVYGRRADQLRAMPRRALTKLADLRRYARYLKPGVDLLRGILTTAFLPCGTGELPEPHPPTLEQFARLLSWLKATGEYTEELARLEAWLSFLTGRPHREAAGFLAEACDLAAWFETRSTVTLGLYTRGLCRFLHETLPGHRWREDLVFCARPRVEYHLNMVGAEIMSRACRIAFLSRPRKMVVLPLCMRAGLGAGCKARETALGLQCAGCAANCRVNRLTILGREHGFEVLFIPHQSSLFATGTQAPATRAELGVIGVACVVNLLAGGWQLRAMGIPPQCVILDYCSCKSHWHATGFPTDINCAQLMRVLGIDPGQGRLEPMTGRSICPDRLAN